MNPHCCECDLQMTCEKNGVEFIVGYCGYARGDRYECPGCGKRVVTGYGRVAYIESPSAFETLKERAEYHA